MSRQHMSKRDKRRRAEGWDTFPPKAPRKPKHGKGYPMSIPSRAVKGKAGKYGNSVSSTRYTNLFSRGARSTVFYDPVSTGSYKQPKRHKRFSRD